MHSFYLSFHSQQTWRRSSVWVLRYYYGKGRRIQIKYAPMLNLHIYRWIKCAETVVGIGTFSRQTILFMTMSNFLLSKLCFVYVSYILTVPELPQRGWWQWWKRARAGKLWSELLCSLKIALIYYSYTLFTIYLFIMFFIINACLQSVCIRTFEAHWSYTNLFLFSCEFQEKELEKQQLLFQQARLHQRGASEMVLQIISASRGMEN